MELKELTTVVKRLSKKSDTKYNSKYTPKIVAIIKDIDEYNDFNIYTKLDDPEDKRSFSKDVLKPIEDRYQVIFHQ